MKQYIKISIAFSLLFLAVTLIGKCSLASQHNILLQKPSYNYTSHQYSATSAPNNTVIKINHRSAENIKSQKVSPNLPVVYALPTRDSSPCYFLQQYTYFHFVIIDLIHDIVIPPSLSLRAPPLLY
jgi:hypothetical protein